MTDLDLTSMSAVDLDVFAVLAHADTPDVDRDDVTAQANAPHGQNEDDDRC